jgi:hypothetical protein
MKRLIVVGLIENAIRCFVPLALSRSALGVAAWAPFSLGPLLETGDKQCSSRPRT